MTAGRQTLPEALERIERVRRARAGRFYLRDERITLSHGSGGKATHNLIEGVFAEAFSNPILDLMEDSAVLSLEGSGERIAFTTDSYVVRPLFFPGGDIGRLAVHGTVNDLAMVGARPEYLSVAVILEEGFSIDDLRRIVGSIEAASADAGVQVVTGDTKVVERGKADGLYLNTAGVGRIPPRTRLSSADVRVGDRVLVSGRIAEHGIAILLAREELHLESTIESDTAPLAGLTAALLSAAGDGVRALRDPTRGGIAAALNEIALRSGVAIAVDEHAFPIRTDVRGACELLGIDPLHVANEGKLLAIVAAERTDDALAALRDHPLGADATVVGEVEPEPGGTVFVRTGIGGRRVLDMLVGDALPRIC